MDDLLPVRKRNAKPLMFERLVANITAVGLIEPLLVHPYKGTYFIIDGYLRYLALKKLGVASVPCLLIESLDLYTPNRQVSYLSMSQRWRMLKQALTVVDESRLKAALAFARLRTGFTAFQRTHICPEVLERVESEKITRNAAVQFIWVTKERQRDILKTIDEANDSSVAFIRSQIIRTPVEQRQNHKGRNGPWSKLTDSRQQLVDKLVDAERRSDFYRGLYNEYAADLVRLTGYARQCMCVPAVRRHLEEYHPSELALMQQILIEQGDGATTGRGRKVR